jgi:hypothetical protein
MSKAQNPLTGQMSGSMANFVTTTWNGENVIRSKAFTIKDANTPAQQMQRASFKLISDEHQSWGGIATESFPERGTGQTAFNAFVALNLKGAVDKTGEVPVIDYSKLQVSGGTMVVPAVSEAKVTAAGISISYRSNVRIPGVNATDRMIAVAKTTEGELLMQEQQRGDVAIGTLVVDYPGIKATDIKCCYLYALNADGTKASASRYVELV